MKKKFFFVLFFIFTLVSFAEEITLSGFSGQKDWKKNGIVPVQGTGGFNINFDYICHGRVQLFCFVKFFDQDHKQIGKEFLCRPPLHFPNKDNWDKKFSHTFSVRPFNIPEGTKTIDIRLSADSKPQFRKGNTSITVIDPRIEWIYRMEPENRMGFFDLKNGVTFKGTLPPGMTGVRGTVFNSDGKKVFSAVSKDGIWKFPAKKPGFYHVKFAWFDRNGKDVPVVEDLLFHPEKRSSIIEFGAQKRFPRDIRCFAVTASAVRDPADLAEGFGFNFETNSSNFVSMQDRFDMIRMIGWNDFIRVHWIRWNVIEAKKGVYDWSSADKFLGHAERSGLPAQKIVLNIMGTPRWNSPKGEQKENLNWMRSYTYFAPIDMKPWGNFVSAILKRYPGLMGLELWNEPHLKGGSIFWQSSTEQFVELMKTGYEAAKKTSPETPVVMGGIGGKHYFPFYQEFVKLGGNKYLDIHSSHNGYDQSAYFACDKQHGETVKPWWELEWHTVLYNCGIPEIPSEEEVTFRMLIHLADLLYMGYDKIAAYGSFCNEKTPETARDCKKVGGIQQVAGLFRSAPYIEPRLAACAMRTVSDLFSGKRKVLGAWNYPDQWQGALFESRSGKVLFFWCSNEKGNGKVPSVLRSALKNAKIIDWEGREVSLGSLRTRRMYFAENPDEAFLKKGTKHTGPIQMVPKKPILDQTFIGCYGNPDHAQKLTEFHVFNKKTEVKPTSGKFDVSFSRNGMKLIAEIKDAKHVADSPNLNFWDYDSLQFAIDCVGDGFNEDIIEFCVGGNGKMYKTRMPALKGDIPAKYSEAGKLLTDSTAVVTRKGDVTRYEINVSAGDLFPFVYVENQKVRFSLLVNNNDGNGREGWLYWGKGIGESKAAFRYGSLAPCGKKISRIDIRAFQEADVEKGEIIKVTAKGNGKRGSGITFGISHPVSGAYYKLSCEVRGSGNFEGMHFTKILPRTNLKAMKLNDQWQKIDIPVFLPAGKNQHLTFVLFFWQQPEAKAEIRNFKIETL